MPIIKDNTEKFFGDINKKVSAGLKKVTLAVERDAKLFVPVKTGTLKRSITHEFISQHTAIVGSNVEYAPHVELGTSKMSAQPYLRPALHKNLGLMKKIFGVK